MRKPKSKFGQYGYDEGYQASFDTNWQENEMQEKFDADELGEVASEILEHWQQMAGTIYYDDVSDANIERFEDGFFQGFEDGVRQQLKKTKVKE